MKIMLLLAFYCVTSFALAGEKSLDLDRVKAAESKLECLRLSQYRPLNKIKVSCQEDNHHYESLLPSRPFQKGETLRIGNFNLLHPGMDKTLFKDFALVAQLIDENFDVMAGIELIDVVGDARDYNKKQQNELDVVYQQYLTAKTEYDLSNAPSVDPILVNNQKIKLEELAAELSAQQLLLQNVMLEKNEIDNSIARIEIEFNMTISQVLIKHMRPGFTIFGWEPMRNRRLKRLQYFKETFQKQTDLNLKINIYVQKLKSLQLEIDQLDIPAVSQGPSKEATEKLEIATQKMETMGKKYKLPGYLRLLNELRKIDASWSLVLSPFGDALEESHTQELTGFFYKNGKMTLKENIHCTEKYNQKSTACYPNFSQEWQQMFSRRPFLATFEVADHEYSLLAAHVIFTSPLDDTTQSAMLNFAFQNDNLKTLGKGINKDNYARFVEVKGTLELMKNLDKQGLKNIIYMGDLNLESELPYWKTLLQSYPDMNVLVDQKTSLSNSRFAGTKPTMGLSNTYDHFILNTVKSAHCNKSNSVDFINGAFSQRINQKYLVRNSGDKAPYSMMENAQEKIDKFVLEFTQNVAINEPQSNEKTLEDDLQNLKDRVFNSQFKDSDYYKYFQQIISDHLPIQLSCEIN